MPPGFVVGNDNYATTLPHLSSTTPTTPGVDRATRSKSMWITIPEAASRLSVSDKTVRRLIASGDLPAQRFGKRLIRINADKLTGTPIGGAIG